MRALQKSLDLIELCTKDFASTLRFLIVQRIKIPLVLRKGKRRSLHSTVPGTAQSLSQAQLLKWVCDGCNPQQCLPPTKSFSAFSFSAHQGFSPLLIQKTQPSPPSETTSQPLRASYNPLDTRSLCEASPRQRDGTQLGATRPHPDLGEKGKGQVWT